jgi:hypothetical protein
MFLRLRFHVTVRKIRNLGGVSFSIQRGDAASGIHNSLLSSPAYDLLTSTTKIAPSLYLSVP